jgi:dTDP-4-amino-4,6-dideoxygalactose transaminase
MNDRRSNLALYGGAASVTTIAQWPPDDPEIHAAIEAAVADGSWGKYHAGKCDDLAERLAALHEVAHCCLCSSGTVAVELALRGLQVAAGDEVILAGYDFAGNFRAIDAIGARPVLVDIEPASWCVDANELTAAANDRVRAIIVSHLHGGLADMPAICKIAEAHGWAVVEDACQATAATVYGRPAGTWGDVGVLSFGGSKLLTAGRGGALLTRHPEILQRIKIYSGRGNNAYPLSELQAAVLLPQVDSLHARNQRRSDNVAYLLNRTAGLRGLMPIRINYEQSHPAFYKIAWLYDPSALGGCPIDDFLAMACAERIPLDRGFRGFVRRGDRRCRRVGELPHATKAAEATIVLHHPILLSDRHTMDEIADGLQKIVDAVR